MDESTRAYLEAMESRLTTRSDATEARLMGRMNDNHEQLLQRMRTTDMSVAALTEIVRSTNTTLASLTSLLTIIASGHADLARRMTDLEKKP